MPYRRPVDRPLRRDVRWLGHLLGQVIRDLEGDCVFDLEERIRKLAILRRRGPKHLRRDVAVEFLDLVHALPTEQAEPVIRAFAHYFGLVNLAEQHHRVRRARAHASVRGGTPQRGSLAAVFQHLRAAGVPAHAVRSTIAALEVTLTLTAHPTEATRRTVLEKRNRIAHALELRDSSRLTEREREELEMVVREQIALLWQTDEVRRDKPTVHDEVKNVSWYIESVLWELVPVLSRELGRAFERAYGEPLGVGRVPLRIHSWVGGDMDGNPFVTPDVLADAIRVYRERGLRMILGAVRELATALSQSSRYTTPPERLLASIAADEAAAPTLADADRNRAEGEPWRRKLGFIERRLEATLAEVERQRDRALARPPSPQRCPPWPPYRRASDLESDLEIIAETLEEAGSAKRDRLAQAHREAQPKSGRAKARSGSVPSAARAHDAPRAGERLARGLLERVRALGFGLAELEMRAPASDVRASDALASAPASEVRASDAPASAPASEVRASDAPASAPPPQTETPSAGSNSAEPVEPRTMAEDRIAVALARIAEAQREAGERTCRTLILSMTQEAEDVFAALRCARRAGLYDDTKGCAALDIVPLFETHAALQSSADIVRQLFADPTYRRHLDGRGVQEVMIGYSDSGKEVGLLAASLALYQAQRTLARMAAQENVPMRVFHGRGETVARGGGPAQGAILALPKGSVAGRYKATEQGEALDQKYGRPELGLRTLELVLGGAILHSLDAQPQAPPSAEERYLALFEELATTGKQLYRSLVWDHPQFADFFFHATPIDELAHLPIGSRPSKRRAGGLEVLRAIPWVFAWTQTRAILPAWYGFGGALEEACKDASKRELIHEMYQSWPLFRTMTDNIEMVLAKTDMRIAARYAALAPIPIREAVWPLLTDEHRRARKWVKQLTGNTQLLDKNQPLQRSIRLRNPYVDPLNLFQLELVRRKRRGDPDLTRPILLTVNGVAAGMRNTG